MKSRSPSDGVRASDSANRLTGTTSIPIPTITAQAVGDAVGEAVGVAAPGAGA